MELKPQTVLQGGRYVIQGVLGRGGFGVTYLAEQVMAKRKVCIKEFFPKDYYTRGDDTRSLTLASQGFAESMNRYKEKFVKEAQTIAALDHANIIPIYDVFEENNTAYYVMEYVEGESLSEVVKRRGALAESEAVEYVRQAASALEYLHERKIMHLDIKPGNMMLRRKDNRVVLIDFGLSKHYDEQSGEATSTTPVGVSHGYAPMEQYKQGGVSTFSPETDIYSLGATLYCLLTGQRPPEAASLINDPLEFPQHVSATLRSAITAAMSPSSKQRPASVGKFLAMLSGVGVSDKSEDTIRRDKPIETDKKPIDEKPKPQTTSDEKTKTKKSKWWVWCLLVLVVVIIVRNCGGDDYDTYSADVYQDNTVETDYIVTDQVDEVVTIDSAALFAIVTSDSQFDVVEVTEQSNPQLSLTSKSRMSFDHDKSQGTIKYSLTNTDDVPNVTINKSWITINSVSKSGTINFSVAANSGKESRDATIKVEYRGQYFSVSVTQSGKRYKVGDYYNENGKEGVVFDVWDGGRHGKIVCMDETKTRWDTRIPTKYITHADSEYDGNANTDKIMARSDRDYFPAFTWCRAKGDGWYLPVKSELETINKNKKAINATLSDYGAIPLSGSYSYWLSTENGEFYAWSVYLGSGDTYNRKKYGTSYVRAVSAF